MYIHLFSLKYSACTSVFGHSVVFQQKEYLYPVLVSNSCKYHIPGVLFSSISFFFFYKTNFHLLPFSKLVLGRKLWVTRKQLNCSRQVKHSVSYKSWLYRLEIMELNICTTQLGKVSSSNGRSSMMCAEWQTGDWLLFEVSASEQCRSLGEPSLPAARDILGEVVEKPWNQGESVVDRSPTEGANFCTNAEHQNCALRYLIACSVHKDKT